MPIYETARCVLRKIDVTDASALLRNFSDPRVMAHYDMAPILDLMTTKRLLQEWMQEIAAGERERWVIILKAQERVIGSCGFHGINKPPRCAELGYEIGTAYWGRGIMSEVFPVLVDHAFQRLRIDRLHARIDAENRASTALVRKHGFRSRLAPQLANWLRSGGTRNRQVFRLTREDYVRRSAQLEAQSIRWRQQHELAVETTIPQGMRNRTF